MNRCDVARTLLLFGPLLLAARSPLPARAQDGPDKPPEVLEVKVGVVAYQSLGNSKDENEKSEDNYVGIFDRLQKGSRSASGGGKPAPRMQFKVAYGSYGEVLSWFHDGAVDLAVVSPALFAKIRADARKPPSEYGGAGTRVDCVYLGSRIKKLVSNPFNWVHDTRVGQFRDSYRTVCLVREESTLKKPEDLLDAIGRGGVRLLFVDTYSTSGRLLPEVRLRAMLESRGGTPSDVFRQAKMSYSHNASIERLYLDPRAPGPELVAFVTDVTTSPNLAPAEVAHRLREISIPGLTNLQIPEGVLIARCVKGDGRTEMVARAMEALLQRVKVPPAERDCYFQVTKDWEKNNATLLDLCETAINETERRLVGASGKEPGPPADRVSLDEIGWLLARDARRLQASPQAPAGGGDAGRPPGTSKPNPLRIALVLSGGGAKCAYQVGAIQAIEEEFAEVREQVGKIDPKAAAALDISLVVGTSGGALNAIPVALGVTKEPCGRKALAALWTTLDQRDLIRPSVRIGLLCGAWFASLQILPILWLYGRRRNRAPAEPEARATTGRLRQVRVTIARRIENAGPRGRLGLWLVGLGIAEGLLSLKWLPLDWLGFFHLAEHAWAVLSIGLYWSAVTLISVGLVLVVYDVLTKRFRDGEPSSAKRILIAALVGAAMWTIAVLVADGLGLLDRQVGPQEVRSWYWRLLGIAWLMLAGAAIGATVQGIWILALFKVRDRWKTAYLLLAVSVLLLPLVTAAVWLFVEETVFSQARMQDLVAEKYAGLMSVPLPAESDRLERLSRRVLRGEGRGASEQSEIRRDLVITGSRIDTPAGSEDDLYFYYDSGPVGPPVFKNGQGVDLRQFLPSSLFHVVIGSGSIYPIFPDSRLPDTLNNRAVRLIDGGFAHNSPLEAAVSWGATHVLIVEASPEPSRSQGNLLGNLQSVADFLYTQAQLTDRRSHGQVMVFTLRPGPGPPRLDIIDFAGDRIKDGIQKGYDEARSEGGTGRPPFRLELGQPEFHDVPD